ncbi:MAG: MarR family winged helix-turn-helix transcriptional regulator [Micropepsaceae bacterium]
MARPPESQAQLGWRIFNWIGIINQLATHRAEASLGELKLPIAQFTMLNHFSHRPHEAKTVTGVAAAMQQPQPGITKTIQKLIARKLLKSDPAPDDKRSKLLTITPKGLELHARAVALFVPRFAEALEDWNEAELEQLFARLDKLKVWLDTKGRE